VLLAVNLCLVLNVIVCYATSKLYLLHIKSVQNKVVRYIVGGSDWCVITYEVCVRVCACAMH
jgi:hypothetical protein